MPTIIFYITAVMLFFAAAPLSYGYYTFLRLVVCGVCSYSAYVTQKRNAKVLPTVYGLIAVLFNPIIKIYLPKEVWVFFDISVGVLLLITARFISSQNESL